MIGDIYKLPINDDREGWVLRSLLVLELYEALPYNKRPRSTTASYLTARCLILDTGERYNVYADTLRDSGEKVA